jgi:hypothetical protein
MTISDLVERYLKEVVPRKRGAAVERIVLRAFLRTPLAQTSLSAVAAQDFANYRDERLQRVKASTLRREFGILRPRRSTSTSCSPPRSPAGRAGARRY